MSILHASPAPVKSTRVLFNGCQPIRPTNRHFGLGLARPVREKRVGYTLADLQWAAENLNHDGVTADDDARLAERAMPAEVYHELQAELADCRALARVGCEESFADAYLEAIEAEAIEAPGHQVLRASDGEALAVVLEGLDGSDLQEAADRALAVLAIEGSPPGRVDRPPRGARRHVGSGPRPEGTRLRGPDPALSRDRGIGLRYQARPLRRDDPRGRGAGARPPHLPAPTDESENSIHAYNRNDHSPRPACRPSKGRRGPRCEPGARGRDEPPGPRTGEGLPRAA